MRERDIIISVDDIEKELWYEESPKKPKKQKCRKCKKPLSQCNCNFRGRGKFADN